MSASASSFKLYPVFSVLLLVIGVIPIHLKLLGLWEEEGRILCTHQTLPIYFECQVIASCVVAC